MRRVLTAVALSGLTLGLSTVVAAPALAAVPGNDTVGGATAITALPFDDTVRVRPGSRSAA